MFRSNDDISKKNNRDFEERMKNYMFERNKLA